MTTNSHNHFSSHWNHRLRWFPVIGTLALAANAAELYVSPSGSDTYFIYVDNQDRVVRWEQVLTEERFDTIAQGMTKDQVIERIGITKITHGLARGRGYVWHYRYTTPHCKSFVIEFTPEDIVRSAGYRIRSGRFCKYVGMG